MVEIDTIIREAKQYLPNLNEERVRAAYSFAHEAHKGQYRMDGSPYITHPLSLALILSRLHLDEETLIAALLHDVPEDTDAATLEDIEKLFGKKISFIVDGVTKLSKVKYHNNMAERQIESLKKFFLHSAHDLRIILIKLADRLHNMQTLEYFRKDKQLRIARETMEIYVPIANLLGIWEIKSQLEDLAFRYLYPKEFEQISHHMNRISSVHEEAIRKMVQRVEQALKENKISGHIEYRPKNLFGIFQKMISTEKRFEDMNDLLGFRVIVETSSECYQVLGLIHHLFRPKSGRIKDYIALPKVNGYQSLHTTVFGVDGIPTEFQIRTKAMHVSAEYGVAAHYFYKKKSSSKTKPLLERQSYWMQKVIDLQKEIKSNSDFIRNLKVDVFGDRIFVFTPKGDVFDLPDGATGVDFAYHIHSDLGDHGIRIYRNGIEYPITSNLKMGDTVEVIASSKQILPPREWLEKVKTNLAKRKIKEALKKQSKLKQYHEGIKFMKKLLCLYGLGEFEALSAEQKNRLIETFQMKNWHDFLEHVGGGIVSQAEIIEFLHLPQSILGKPHHNKVDYSPLSNVHYRKVEGELIKLSNVKSTTYYRVPLEIQTKNRVGLLRDLSIYLADLGVNIYQIHVQNDPISKQSTIHLIIEVVDLNQLQNVFDSIEAVEGVLQMKRIHP